MPRRRELLRRLSDAGITPRCLLRLDAELQDHYVDLEREALAAEKSVAEASEEAWLRLGDDDAIAAEFLTHTELKLWIYRWPIALYCLGLIVWLLLILLSPLQGLLRNRAAVARYSLALCSSVALLCALLLSMQFIVTIGPPATNTAAYSVERHEVVIADPSSSLIARERSGAVKDVVVIESTDSLFEHAAIEAAYKFKYRPRVIRGESIEVPGVRNKITFDIAV